MRINDYWLETKQYQALMKFNANKISKLYQKLGHQNSYPISRDFHILGQMSRPAFACILTPMHYVVWIVEATGEVQFITGRERWQALSMHDFVKYMDQKLK